MAPQYWNWPPGGVQVMGVHMAGVEPQTLGMPPPPQVSPALVQAPQSMLPPQLSPTTPQYWPLLCVHWVFMQPTGMLPQTPGVPLPPQVSPAGQGAEQLRPWPQPSPIIPQYWPPITVQVRGAQPLAPWQMPLLQVWPVGHAPQSMVRLQPSPILPQ